MAESWPVLLPVPASAPKPPAAHPTLGRPVACWAYRNAVGAVLGYVARFDRPDGKVFLPLTFCRNGMGRKEWRWKSWPAPRPLYGLDCLAARPDEAIVVCEGEKAADAAGKLLPDQVAVCSPNGAKAAGKADWAPLAGRRAVIWPDADEAGQRYAQDVAKALGKTGAETVAFIVPPGDVEPGWDAADALAEGWSPDRARTVVEAAQPADEAFAGSVRLHAAGVDKRNKQERASTGSRRRGRRPQRDHLLEQIERVDLWHSPEREAFATVPVAAHLENWPVKSRDFRCWLTGEYYDATGGAPGSQAREEALHVIETLALRGPEHLVHLRVGGHDGRVFVDLGDGAWRVVEISATGWKVVDRPPIKFVRSRAMHALPEPEAGASIDALRGFVNVAGDEDFKLLVAYLTGTLRPEGPYPILLVSGEQGTAKSTLARVVLGLLDPRAGALRSLPKDERDLAVAAHNGRVLAFDNVSSVPEALSDALCRLATGGGFGTRELHSDREEVIFDAYRPIILNGIPDLAGRPDLGDRAITVTLEPIEPEARRPESELWRDFGAACPGIMGALFDGVSSALRHVEDTKLARHERMADFALWATAAEPGLGWKAGDFLDVYRQNRAGAFELAVESDPVAAAIRSLLEKRVGLFEGSASELLAELDLEVTEKIRTSRAWPRMPSTLSSRLRRAAPALRQVGIEIEVDHRAPTRDRKRLIVVKYRS